MASKINPVLFIKALIQIILFYFVLAVSSLAFAHPQPDPPHQDLCEQLLEQDSSTPDVISALKSDYFHQLLRLEQTDANSGGIIILKLKLKELLTRLLALNVKPEELKNEFDNFRINKHLVAATANASTTVSLLTSFPLAEDAKELLEILQPYLLSRDSFTLATLLFSAQLPPTTHYQFIQSFKKADWFSEPDRALLEVLEFWLKNEAIPLEQKEVPMERVALNQGLETIAARLALFDQDWRKKLYHRLVLPALQRKTDTPLRLLRSPKLFGEFIRIEDLPLLLTSKHLYGAYGSHFESVNFDKLDSKRLYDEIFLQYKALNIRLPVLLHYAHRLLDHMTLQDLKKISEDDDFVIFQKNLVQYVYNANYRSIDHPLIDAFYPKAPTEFRQQVDLYRASDKGTVQALLEWIETRHQLVDLNQTADPAVDVLERDVAEFIKGLVQNGLSPKDFYEKEILPRMRSPQLSQADFQSLLFVFHVHKKAGLQFDQRLLELFWARYKEHPNLRFVTHYTHPSHVGYHLKALYEERKRNP